MSKDVKEFISIMATLMVLAYLIVPTVIGVDQAKRDCLDNSHSRISTYSGAKYFYKFGCWLGEDV